MAPWWSTDEDSTLRRLYQEGVAIRVIAERVGRSEDAVTERRRVLGIEPRPRARPWSSGEDALLRAGTAAGLAAATIASRLDRAPEQVRRRRRTLVGPGRAAQPYLPEEDEAITACWRRGDDVHALARALGRPPGSLRLRAQKLGVHQPSSRRRWQADEDAELRDGYQLGLTCAQIASQLDGRTATAIAARAAKLGLATYARTWTPAEDQRLRRLVHEGTGLDRGAQLLARTPEALRARARKLGIRMPRPTSSPAGGRRWTPDEDQLLTLHRGLNPAVLAQLLDRSPEAITRRLRRLGLRQGAERSPHHPVPANGRLTPGQRRVVSREMQAGGPARTLALARRLGLRPHDIRRAIDHAGRPATSAAPVKRGTDQSCRKGPVT